MCHPPERAACSAARPPGDCTRLRRWPTALQSLGSQMQLFWSGMQQETELAGAAPAPEERQVPAPSQAVALSPPASAAPVPASFGLAFPQRAPVASPFAKMALARCSPGPFAPSPVHAAAAASAAAAAPAAAAAAGSSPAPMPGPCHDLAHHLKLLLQLAEAAHACASPTTPGAGSGGTAGAAGAAAPATGGTAAGAQARSADVLAYLAGWGRVAEQQGCAVALLPGVYSSAASPALPCTGDRLGERQGGMLSIPRVSPPTSGGVQKPSRRRHGTAPRHVPTP